jgi:hypothetical protein
MRSGKLVAVACALLLPGAAVLAEGPVLTIDKPGGPGPGLAYTLEWGIDPVVPAYLVYDMIEGDLTTLVSPIPPILPGDYTVAVTACLVEDGPLPPPAIVLVPPPAPPAVGQNFYLVMAQATPVACGVGSWNEAFAVAPFTQVGNRDIEIPVDPASCPCP